MSLKLYLLLFARSLLIYASFNELVFDGCSVPFNPATLCVCVLRLIPLVWIKFICDCENWKRKQNLENKVDLLDDESRRELSCCFPSFRPNHLCCLLSIDFLKISLRFCFSSIRKSIFAINTFLLHDILLLSFSRDWTLIKGSIKQNDIVAREIKDFICSWKFFSPRHLFWLRAKDKAGK